MEDDEMHPIASYTNRESLARLAEALGQKTHSSAHKCMAFLMIAVDRFREIYMDDLLVAADKYSQHLKGHRRPEKITLTQAQLYSLMLAYL